MLDVLKISPKPTIDHAKFRVMVGSDGHYWPGKPSTAHKAFCQFVHKYKPDVVVFNGDAMDAARISKYPPQGWEKKPSLEKELSTVRKRMGEIVMAASGSSAFRPRLVWAVGNHDLRFNKALATRVPQFKGVPGTDLAHFFPEWEMCVRVEIGGNRGVVIKHEFKGGTNPIKSNIQASGRSMVTGHHHCQNVTAYTDLNGTRWGVDAGMLAAPDGPQFAYNEGNPVNWRSGFVVLEFSGGKLLPPSLATVLDEKKGKVWLNGSILTV